MISSIKKRFDDLKGTGSELRDNRAYDSLVNLVGEAGALQAIKGKLEQRELTTQEWQVYRKVRSILHKEPLKVGEELSEVNALTNAIIDS